MVQFVAWPKEGYNTFPHIKRRNLFCSSVKKKGSITVNIAKMMYHFRNAEYNQSTGAYKNNIQNSEDCGFKMKYLIDRYPSVVMVSKTEGFGFGHIWLKLFGTLCFQSELSSPFLNSLLLH